MNNFWLFVESKNKVCLKTYTISSRDLNFIRVINRGRI